MAWNGLTQSAVRLVAPPPTLFSFPGQSEPPALPPQAFATPTLDRPFNIDAQLFTELLSVKWPLTIATVYATTVSFLNRYNRRRNNKPWRISKTRPFRWAVIVHNIALAVYSAWTFWGMFHALRRTIPTNEGLVGVVDALCGMQGPRGLSSAVRYDPVAGAWSAGNRAVKLFRGEPDPTDSGRLWNEGLAFFGWLFYLSKYYEVIDTLIILAKGKKSSLLQTYHHTGAMLCMWAGIRFMSPPIWLFVLYNSFIHSLMYSYYTLSALGVRVPMAFKRALTTMQISQFLVGITYALGHLFVEYDVPAEKPYLFVKNLSTALPSVTSSIIAAATAGAGSWLKKIALRAAGSEGAAENVLNEQGELFGSDAFNAIDFERAREELRYRWDTASTACIDTPGQTFAIILNASYLAPLTYLFVMFFIRSYIKKASKRRPSIHDIQENVRASSIVAAGKVNRAVLRAMSGVQGSYSDLEYLSGVDSATDLKKLGMASKAELDKVIEEFRAEEKAHASSSSSSSSSAMSKSQTLAKDLAEATRDTVTTTKSYAAAAAGNNKPRENETNDERRARELVERAYAAASNAAMHGGDASETVSIETREERYEVSVDEITTKEEKSVDEEFNPGPKTSGNGKPLFN